jgi:uncharacterized protein
MKVQELLAHAPRTYAVVFDIGEEVSHGLLDFARTHRVHAAHFTALGAFRRATLGFWDWDRKEYRRNAMEEQVEVVSLVGNLALGPDGEPWVHAHVVVANSAARAFGGHLLEGHVRPTLEAVVTESPTYLRRRHDERTGLALIAAGSGGNA